MVLKYWSDYDIYHLCVYSLICTLVCLVVITVLSKSNVLCRCVFGI